MRWPILDSRLSMAITLQKLRKITVMTPRQHAYLLSAVRHLAWARMEFGRRQAGEFIARLQDRPTDETRKRGNLDVALASWAVGAAASGVPWRADCLIQSMAADRWLRRNGIVADFRLGVISSGNGSILGHAWIELDGVVLTGGKSVEQYRLLIGE